MDSANALRNILDNLEDSFNTLEDSLTDVGKSLTKSTMHSLKKSGLQQKVGKAIKSVITIVKKTTSDDKLDAALLAASLLLL